MPDGHLLDANVLLALYDPRHVHHASARSWFEDVDLWATTPLTEAAFVRLVSNALVAGEHGHASHGRPPSDPAVSGIASWWTTPRLPTRTSTSMRSWAIGR